MFYQFLRNEEEVHCVCGWKSSCMNCLLLCKSVSYNHVTWFSYIFMISSLCWVLIATHKLMLHYPKRIFRFFIVLTLNNLTLDLWYYLLIHRKCITSPARTLSTSCFSHLEIVTATPYFPPNYPFVQTQSLYMLWAAISHTPYLFKGLI